MTPRRFLVFALTGLAAIAGCANQKSPPPAQTATTAIAAPVASTSAPPAKSTSLIRELPGAPDAGIAIDDVVIDQALFGSGTRLADVTDRVVQLLRSEPGGFTATADWLHADPTPGKNKSLLIRYRFRGKPRSFMVTGGNRASYAALIAIDEIGR